jgi:hypothetical protein
MRFLSGSLLLILLASPVCFSSDKASKSKPSSAQRLRVRLERVSLQAGETTRVFVEFLDMNYGQVANDATRVIELGQTSPGSKQIGSGYFSPQRIKIRPGEWFREATFSSTSPGRLLITAHSAGLESGQALVIIKARKPSFISSLFKPTGNTQPDEGFEILPKKVSATADHKHRAKFQLAFQQPPRAGTTVRINTNLTAGSILYKDQPVGSSVANITLAEGEDISGEIALISPISGRIEILASVLPNGPEDHAQAEFTPPRPAQILFDSEPLSIESHACTVPVSVRLADEGGFPVEPDRERRIHFRSAVDSDAISFEPESVVLSPGQRFAQVVFRLKERPHGNEIKLLATSDQELMAGTKSILIKSAIDRVSVTGPSEVSRGGREAEFIVRLVDKNGKQLAADWNRKIELSVVGGGLAATELVIPKGVQQAVVKYVSPDVIGSYTLTAASSGLLESVHTINVVHPPYWVILIAVLGGIIGGIGRLIHKNCKFKGVIPCWTGDRWNLGLLRALAGSLVGGLFLYWALKLGLSQALGPKLPANLDLGTNTAVVFFSGIGGFAGTPVLDRLVRWILPPEKPKTKTVRRAT